MVLLLGGVYSLILLYMILLLHGGFTNEVPEKVICPKKDCEVVLSPFDIKRTDPLNDLRSSENFDTNPGDMFRDIDGDPNIKTISEVHDNGFYTSLCWIEITTITETKNGSKSAIREYAITFETPSDIPEKYVNNRTSVDVDGEKVPYKIFDRDTKKSEVVNFTTVSKSEDTVVRQNKKVLCGSGPIYTKEFMEWPHSDRKRVEIRVSPKKQNLIASNCIVLNATLEDLSTLPPTRRDFGSSSLHSEAPSAEEQDQFLNKFTQSSSIQITTENIESEIIFTADHLPLGPVVKSQHGNNSNETLVTKSPADKDNKRDQSTSKLPGEQTMFTKYDMKSEKTSTSEPRVSKMKTTNISRSKTPKTNRYKNPKQDQATSKLPGNQSRFTKYNIGYEQTATSELPASEIAEINTGSSKTPKIYESVDHNPTLQLNMSDPHLKLGYMENVTATVTVSVVFQANTVDDNKYNIQRNNVTPPHRITESLIKYGSTEERLLNIQNTSQPQIGSTTNHAEQHLELGDFKTTKRAPLLKHTTDDFSVSTSTQVNYKGPNPLSVPEPFLETPDASYHTIYTPEHEIVNNTSPINTTKPVNYTIKQYPNVKKATYYKKMRVPITREGLEHVTVPLKVTPKLVSDVYRITHMHGNLPKTKLNTKSDKMGNGSTYTLEIATENKNLKENLVTVKPENELEGEQINADDMKFKVKNFTQPTVDDFEKYALTTIAKIPKKLKKPIDKSKDEDYYYFSITEPPATESSTDDITVEVTNTINSDYQAEVTIILPRDRDSVTRTITKDDPATDGTADDTHISEKFTKSTEDATFNTISTKKIIHKKQEESLDLTTVAVDLSHSKVVHDVDIQSHTSSVGSTTEIYLRESSTERKGFLKTSVRDNEQRASNVVSEKNGDLTSYTYIQPTTVKQEGNVSNNSSASVKEKTTESVSEKTVTVKSLASSFSKESDEQNKVTETMDPLIAKGKITGGISESSLYSTTGKSGSTSGKQALDVQTHETSSGADTHPITEYGSTIEGYTRSRTKKKENIGRSSTFTQEAHSTTRTTDKGLSNMNLRSSSTKKSRIGTAINIKETTETAADEIDEEPVTKVNYSNSIKPSVQNYTKKKGSLGETSTSSTKEPNIEKDLHSVTTVLDDLIKTSLQEQGTDKNSAKDVSFTTKEPDSNKSALKGSNARQKQTVSVKKPNTEKAYEKDLYVTTDSSETSNTQDKSVSKITEIEDEENTGKVTESNTYITTQELNNESTEIIMQNVSTAQNENTRNIALDGVKNQRIRGFSEKGVHLTTRIFNTDSTEKYEHGSTTKQKDDIRPTIKGKIDRNKTEAYPQHTSTNQKPNIYKVTAVTELPDTGANFVLANTTTEVSRLVSTTEKFLVLSDLKQHSDTDKSLGLDRTTDKIHSSSSTDLNHFESDNNKTDETFQPFHERPSNEYNTESTFPTEISGMINKNPSSSSLSSVTNVPHDTATHVKPVELEGITTETLSKSSYKRFGIKHSRKGSTSLETVTTPHLGNDTTEISVFSQKYSGINVSSLKNVADKISATTSKSSQTDSTNMDDSGMWHTTVLRTSHKSPIDTHSKTESSAQPGANNSKNDLFIKEISAAPVKLTNSDNLVEDQSTVSSELPIRKSSSTIQNPETESDYEATRGSTPFPATKKRKNKFRSNILSVFHSTIHENATTPENLLYHTDSTISNQSNQISTRISQIPLQRTTNIGSTIESSTEIGLGKVARERTTKRPSGKLLTTVLNPASLFESAKISHSGFYNRESTATDTTETLYELITAVDIISTEISTNQSKSKIIDVDEEELNDHSFSQTSHRPFITTYFAGKSARSKTSKNPMKNSTTHFAGSISTTHPFLKVRQKFQSKATSLRQPKLPGLTETSTVVSNIHSLDVYTATEDTTWENATQEIPGLTTIPKPGQANVSYISDNLTNSSGVTEIRPMSSHGYSSSSIAPANLLDQSKTTVGTILSENVTLKGRLQTMTTVPDPIRFNTTVLKNIFTKTLRPSIKERTNKTTTITNLPDHFLSTPHEEYYESPSVEFSVSNATIASILVNQTLVTRTDTVTKSPVEVIYHISSYKEPEYEYKEMNTITPLSHTLVTKSDTVTQNPVDSYTESDYERTEADVMTPLSHTLVTENSEEVIKHISSYKEPDYEYIDAEVTTPLSHTLVTKLDILTKNPVEVFKNMSSYTEPDHEYTEVEVDTPLSHTVVTKTDPLTENNEEVFKHISSYTEVETTTPFTLLNQQIESNGTVLNGTTLSLTKYLDSLCNNTKQKVLVKVKILMEHILEGKDKGKDFQYSVPIMGIEKQTEFDIKPKLQNDSADVPNETLNKHWDKFLDDLARNFFSLNRDKVDNFTELQPQNLNLSAPEHDFNGKVLGPNASLQRLQRLRNLRKQCNNSSRTGVSKKPDNETEFRIDKLLTPLREKYSRLTTVQQNQPTELKLSENLPDINLVLHRYLLHSALESTKRNSYSSPTSDTPTNRMMLKNEDLTFRTNQLNNWSRKPADLNRINLLAPNYRGFYGESESGRQFSLANLLSNSKFATQQYLPTVYNSPPGYKFLQELHHSNPSIGQYKHSFLKHFAPSSYNSEVLTNIAPRIETYNRISPTKGDPKTLLGAIAPNSHTDTFASMHSMAKPTIQTERMSDLNFPTNSRNSFSLRSLLPLIYFPENKIKLPEFSTGINNRRDFLVNQQTDKTPKFNEATMTEKSKTETTQKLLDFASILNTIITKLNSIIQNLVNR